jgi:hypothetical protein
MRQIYFGVICIILLTVFNAAAQTPPPPVPVIESDIRFDTIKMRSIELERVKREAEKSAPDESIKDRRLKFIEIKTEFESIQKLQDSIIDAYTKGKKADYLKIAESAEEIRKNAIKLDENLFESRIINEKQVAVTEESKPTSIKKLIVDLDEAIGKFVGNKIFQSSKLIDQKESEQAQIELKMIIETADKLSFEAKKFK